MSVLLSDHVCVGPQEYQATGFKGLMYLRKVDINFVFKSNGNNTTAATEIKAEKSSHFLRE